MRPLQALARKGLSFGGTGSFVQPPHWASDMVEDRLSVATTWRGDREQIEANFDGYITGAYKANGIVFACVQARARVFSQARFQYQRFSSGRPGDLFGDESLSILETPWPNGTTSELLTRMEQDGSLAGNFFATAVDEGQRIRRLRPDWVTIVTGSPSDDPYDLNAKVLGYLYEPTRGPRQSKPVLLTPDQVVHWSPIPDPDAQWRGMSWLTPVLREIEGDSAATKHKLKFFQNGATANFVVTYDANISEDSFRAFVHAFNEAHQGTDNAYKTIHLGGGADAKTLGADLKQLDFKVTQGAGETRIAAAAGAHPVIVGLSEGMQGSSLNTGNFAAAKRLFADSTITDLWVSASASLAKLVAEPPETRLWFDVRDIPFLKEDQKDAADILSSNASTIAALVAAGWNSDAAIAAVTAGDLKQLVGEHSGLYSVQLQAPGGEQSDMAAARNLVEMIQKVYLGVGVVLTAEEARNVLNRAGAGLTGPVPIPA